MLKKLPIKNIALFSLLASVLFYILRASFRKGDFIGYVNAGHLVLSGQDLYSDYLNTWPPFFSICCVPLSILDTIHHNGVRLLWLLLTVCSMFWLMRITVNWVYDKRLLLPFYKENLNNIAFTNALVFIPFIILFRYLLDNLANIQINVFLLFASVLTIDLFMKNKYLLSGMMLAFIISLKVFPIFLLFYWMFKRESKLVAWTLFFLLLFNGSSLLVYGVDQGIAYYEYWWNEIASKTVSLHHKNQSLLALLRRLMMEENPGLDIYMNLVDLPLDTFKKVASILLVTGALYPMYLFSNKLADKKGAIALLEYAFILTSIPILSPLAWKAYFIFLWPGYLLTFQHLYSHRDMINPKTKRVLRILFLISVLFTVFSTDLFLGRYYADLTEVYGMITIGTLILMGVLLAIYVSEKKNSIPSTGTDLN